MDARPELTVMKFIGELYRVRPSSVFPGAGGSSLSSVGCSLVMTYKNPFSGFTATPPQFAPPLCPGSEIVPRRLGGVYTPPSLRGTISLPGHNGGANWGGVAVNPEKGFLYVITKEHPTLDKLEPPAPGKTEDGLTRYNSPINFITVSSGLASIGPPWSNLTAYDLNTGTMRWQVPNGGVVDLEKEGHSNTGARDPRGGPVVTAGGLIFAATASDHKIRAYDE